MNGLWTRITLDGFELLVESEREFDGFQKLKARHGARGSGEHGAFAQEDIYRHLVHTCKLYIEHENWPVLVYTDNMARTSATSGKPAKAKKAKGPTTKAAKATAKAAKEPETDDGDEESEDDESDEKGGQGRLRCVARAAGVDPS